MPLIKDHEKYHSMCPKDVKLLATMPLQISRTTAETGEQFTVEVPIYVDDSRELMNDRINFALSIMQDRMEHVNQAVVEAREKAQAAQRAKVMVHKVRALEKRLKKGKITQEVFDQELADLEKQFGTKASDLEKEVPGEDEPEDESDSEENQLAEA